MYCTIIPQCCRYHTPYVPREATAIFWQLIHYARVEMRVVRGGASSVRWCDLRVAAYEASGWCPPTMVGCFFPCAVGSTLPALVLAFWLSWFDGSGWVPGVSHAKVASNNYLSSKNLSRWKKLKAIPRSWQKGGFWEQGTFFLKNTT